MTARAQRHPVPRGLPPRRPRRKARPEPAESAQEAGLRYVSDTMPGIARRRAGGGFTYVGPDGRRITSPKEIARIRSLAIPPAYTDVWICPYANGHIQATGRDARGRKQYRYHPRWREVRDVTKFERMLEFSRVLPAIRRRVSEELAKPGLSREKVLATVVRLLETTCIRVGNEEYRKANGTVGLTTLRNGHVRVRGGRIFFRFRAKGGKLGRITLADRSVARIVRECQEIPGYELFQYLGEDGAPRPIDSADVNEYLREATGCDLTAKDFRTWMGTVHAVARLRELLADAAHRPTKKELVGVIDH
ncbi:MAG: DNA topoisomerase IB, partial [Chloroflexota bacterium]|nr:DNA topoisomerase IB [Chloroflexota bacterium]